MRTYDSGGKAGGDDGLCEGSHFDLSVGESIDKKIQCERRSFYTLGSSKLIRDVTVLLIHAGWPAHQQFRWQQEAYSATNRWTMLEDAKQRRYIVSSPYISMVRNLLVRNIARQCCSLAALADLGYIS